MPSFLSLFLLVLGGSFVSSLTGVGGGVLILAGLLMVYPPELAVPLHSFTQLVSNGLRTFLFFRQVDWRVVGCYGLLMLPAAWLGAEIFDLINPDLLKILIGLIILVSIMPVKWKPQGAPDLATFTWLGALSGFLGVFVGAVGPMVLPFFNRLKLSRDAILSTKSAGQALLQLSKILAFSGAGGVDFMALKGNIALLVAGSLAGVLLSIPIGKKIPDEKFNLAINVLLALISCKVIYEGVRGLLPA